MMMMMMMKGSARQRQWLKGRKKKKNIDGGLTVNNEHKRAVPAPLATRSPTATLVLNVVALELSYMVGSIENKIEGEWE